MNLPSIISKIIQKSKKPKKAKGSLLPVEKRPISYYAISHGKECLSDVKFLKKNGYIVIPNAVESSICDKLSNYYSSSIRGEKFEDIPQPLFEFFDEDKKHHYAEKINNYDASKLIGLKMIDLYSYNKYALEAMFAPKITAALKLIFDSDILAFQQLGMINGTEQPLHQDTAYVRVSEPNLIAASWIALEDIKEGTGELELVPGSHTYKSFKFNSTEDEDCRLIEKDPANSTWWNYKDADSHQLFLDQLERLRSDHGTYKFYPKKGDCLIWISQLAHGGSKITSNTNEHNPTRKSLVTHYCPYPQADPMYAKNQTNSGVIKNTIQNTHYSYREFV